MLSDMQQHAQQIQDTAKGGLSVALMTTPLWIERLETLLDITLVAVGIGVGVSTIYLNIIKTNQAKRAAHEQENTDDS